MNNITIEAVDLVIERTGVSYKEAKEALIAANGDAIDAIILIEESRENAAQAEADARARAEAEQQAAHNSFGSEGKRRIDQVVNYVREMIARGNVEKIRLTREGRVLLTIPVSVGVAGGIIGIASAPLVVLAAALAAYGLHVRIEIIRPDGSQAGSVCPDEPDFETIVDQAAREWNDFFGDK